MQNPEARTGAKRVGLFCRETADPNTHSNYDTSLGAEINELDQCVSQKGRIVRKNIEVLFFGNERKIFVAHQILVDRVLNKIGC